MDSVPSPVMGSALIGHMIIVWNVLPEAETTWLTDSISLEPLIPVLCELRVFQPWILSAAFQQQRVALVRHMSMTLLAARAELVEASLTLNL